MFLVSVFILNPITGRMACLIPFFSFLPLSCFLFFLNFFKPFHLANAQFQLQNYDNGFCIFVYLKVEGASDKGGRGPSIWDSFTHTNGVYLFSLLLSSRQKSMLDKSWTHIVEFVCLIEMFLLFQVKLSMEALVTLQWINIIDIRFWL